MAAREITKKTIAVSIDVNLEQRLREFAKAEGRTVSYIVERSVKQAIDNSENQDTLSLAELTRLNRLLWKQLQNLCLSLGIEQTRLESSVDGVFDAHYSEFGHSTVNIDGKVGVDYGLGIEFGVSKERSVTDESHEQK